MDKQWKTATVSQPPDAFRDSHSDFSEAQLMTTSQTPLVSRSLPGTLQSISHNSPLTSAVPQAPQLSAVSQAPRLPAGSLVPQLSAVPQAHRLPTVSQEPQLPAVSLVSPVQQHYASPLVPQHSAAPSPSLLSTGSTSQMPQTPPTLISATLEMMEKSMKNWPSHMRCIILGSV